MVELKILAIVLCHDHAVVVDWAKNGLESIVADNRVQKSGRDHDCYWVGRPLVPKVLFTFY